jgi:multiple sugar transport system substrate-binding protein
MGKLLLKGLEPKYIHIEKTLRDEINRGVYKVNDKIPSENILPKRFNVSKMTVVKAIDGLVRDGILERVRGSGTFVSAKSKTVHLSVGYYGDNSWIYDEFERENPQIKLNRIVYSNENIIGVYENCDIDVLHLTDYAFGYFKAQKKLLDLTDYFESEIFDQKFFFGDVLKIFEHRRKQYGIPFIFSPLVICFNKKIFNDSGIAYPENGWNNAEFLAIAKALTLNPDAEGIIRRYGFLISQYRNRWPVYVLQEGGVITDGRFDAPEVVAGLKWVGDLLHKHKVCPIYPNMDKFTFQKLFIDGHGAMLLDSCYSLGTFLQSGIDCGFSTLPRGKCDVTGLVADAFAVSSKCKKVDAAIRLIKFALSEKIQKRIKVGGFGLPSRKAIALSGSDVPEGIAAEEYSSFFKFFSACNGHNLLDVSDPTILAPFWRHADYVWANMESAKNACLAARKEINGILASRSDASFSV